MRILVFSDSHGNISACEMLMKKISGVDMIIHAGDHAADAKKLEAEFSGTDVRYVKGNCDYTDAPDDLLIEANKKRIFLTHGHRYNVKFDSDFRTLSYKAMEADADLAVFGHTHIPFYENLGNIILLNPGSIKYTRTFGVIEIDGPKISADICDADKWL